MVSNADKNVVLAERPAEDRPGQCDEGRVVSEATTLGNAGVQGEGSKAWTCTFTTRNADEDSTFKNTKLAK